MGQYYKTLFIDDRQYMYPIDYGWAGLKLMEHSWVGGSYRNGVIAHLMTKKDGCRLAHLGDYSDGDLKDKSGSVQIDDDIITSYLSLYDMCWTSGIDDRFRMPRISDKEIKEFEWCKTVWVVNEDQHEYIRCDFKTPENEWRICPLLILLAVGNGSGGGDYHGINMDRVGSWAFDKIKVHFEEPSEMYNLEENGPLFKEG